MTRRISLGPHPMSAQRRMESITITAQADFQPGDLPPDGYLAWHEWADVQRRAGIRQTECPTCGLWRTPQELSSREISYLLKDRFGSEMRFSEYQCRKCFNKHLLLMQSDTPDA